MFSGGVVMLANEDTRVFIYIYIEVVVTSSTTMQYSDVSLDLVVSPR